LRTGAAALQKRAMALKSKTREFASNRDPIDQMITNDFVPMDFLDAENSNLAGSSYEY
jgi:hypothetical protein